MDNLKIVRKSSTGMTRFIENIFYDDDVNPKSLASLILLNDLFRKLDVDYLTEWELRAKKIGFSREYLTKQKAIHGDLVCAYCGTPHLIIEMDGMIVPHPRKATIDHIIPLANGVNFFDEKNLTVACGRCNSRKGHKPVEQFKQQCHIK